MSETIQFPSDRVQQGQSERPRQSLPAEAQPLIVVGFSAKPEGRAARKRALGEARLRSAALVVVDTSPEAEAADLAAELAASGIAYEIRTPADVDDSAAELIKIAETTTP